MTMLSEVSDDLLEELHRSTDISTVVDRHVQNAIRHYSGRRWWFNTADGASFNTADGTETYSIPSPLRLIDTVSITVDGGSNYYLLRRRSNRYLEDRYTPGGTYKGYPRDWGIHADTIRMGPIPNGVYAVRTQGYGIALPVSTSDDSTPWANEAYDLTRLRAKLTLERDYLRYPPGEWASTQMSLKEAERDLMNESNKRTASMTIAGWST